MRENVFKPVCSPRWLAPAAAVAAAHGDAASELYLFTVSRVCACLRWAQPASVFARGRERARAPVNEFEMGARAARNNKS